MTKLSPKELLARGQTTLQNLSLPLTGSPLPHPPTWPRHVTSLPLARGVKLEVSGDPAAVSVVFDVFQLVQGGKSALRAAKTAGPAGRAAAQSAVKAAGTKAANQALFTGLQKATASSKSEELLEGLKTYLGCIPGLSALAPLVNLLQVGFHLYK